MCGLFSPLHASGRHTEYRWIQESSESKSFVHCACSRCALPCGIDCSMRLIKSFALAEGTSVGYEIVGESKPDVAPASIMPIQIFWRLLQTKNTMNGSSFAPQSFTSRLLRFWTHLTTACFCLDLITLEPWPPCQKNWTLPCAEELENVRYVAVMGWREWHVKTFHVVVASSLNAAPLPAIPFGWNQESNTSS